MDSNSCLQFKKHDCFLTSKKKYKLAEKLFKIPENKLLLNIATCMNITINVYNTF